MSVLRLTLAGVLCVATAHAAREKPLYSQEQIQDFCRRFEIWPSRFHFPPESFLGTGYAPPGGYVKDFGVLFHDGRLHLFHIDGRPEERCTVSGNEICFGHASTADFRHWIRHRMPLAVGDRPWQNEHVRAPFVTQWNSRFYMFYMAAGRRTPGVLASAVCDDLETWTKSDGPIVQAKGRDPFVRDQDDRIDLYYTANAGGVEVVSGTDMIHWSTPHQVIRNPKRAPAESSSVHRVGDRWVLWYNDYVGVDGASGDFRTMYVFSKDPLNFDCHGLKEFDFKTPLQVNRDSYDWVEKASIPVSIELVEKGNDTWLVCYFRWYEGKFRLFFGAVDWSCDPARIEEITTDAKLEETLSRVHDRGSHD